MKKSKILLYLSSLLILVHFVDHFIGHLSWKTPKDANIQNVVNAMIESKTSYMGVHRSLADFYHGYSLLLFVIYILSIWIFIVSANSHRRDIKIVKTILFPFGIAYIVFGIIEFRQFFPLAASLSFLAGLLILLSILFSRKF